MIVAQGSRFGGFSLFVIDGKLTYVYNFLGIPPEQQIVADAPSSGRHIVGVEFAKERMGEHHEAHGTMRLYIDDEVVAEAQIGRSPRATASAARGSASATTAVTPSAASTRPVPVHRRDDRQGRDRRRRRRYLDVEAHMAAAMARD